MSCFERGIREGRGYGWGIWSAVLYFDGEVKKIRSAMLLLAFTNMLGFAFTSLVSRTKGRTLEEISGEDDQGNDTTQGPAIKCSVSRYASGTYA